MNKEVKQLEYQIPFSQEEYLQTLVHSHFREADFWECLKIEKELVLSDIKARAWYRWEQEDKILVVMTLGQVFDDLTERYERKEELLLAYAVECLAMELLKKSYDIFKEAIYEREGKYPGEYYFLNDEEMIYMSEILEQMRIREVRCNEAFALIPQKTIVFLTELSYEKKGGCIRLCENCSQVNCPNRMQTLEERRPVLNYGYQRILGNGENELWKRD